MVLKLEWIRLVLGLNGIDRWAMVAIITYPSLAAPNVNERVKAQQKLKWNFFHMSKHVNLGLPSAAINLRKSDTLLENKGLLMWEKIYLTFDITA